MNLKICNGHDESMLDESITWHRLHCPDCDFHLTSLFLCGRCMKRYEFEPAMLPYINADHPMYADFVQAAVLWAREQKAESSNQK